MKKVYCCNCKWYEDWIIQCKHPMNFTYKDHFFGISKERKSSPAIMNQKNNCEFYKRKWWKFWV